MTSDEQAYFNEMLVKLLAQSNLTNEQMVWEILNGPCSTRRSTPEHGDVTG